MSSGSRIRRFEILLRTGSEHGRTQAPVAMLDAAVKRGLGSVIDRRSQDELVTWLARHPEAWRSDPLLCSINLSPSALADDHFRSSSSCALPRRGCRAACSPSSSTRASASSTSSAAAI